MQRLFDKIFHFHRMTYKGGNIEMIKFLIDLSKELMIDINRFNDACTNGQTEIVKLMIQSSKEYNIDLNEIDEYGKTGFMKACLNGRTEMVKILINSSREFGIDLNARSINSSKRTDERTIGDRKTGFIYACINSHIEAVKWMIENREEFGIDIRRKDLKNRTALDCVKSFIAVDLEVVDEALPEVKKLLENEYRKPTHKYNLRSRKRHSKDDESQPVAKKYKVK